MQCLANRGEGQEEPPVVEINVERRRLHDDALLGIIPGRAVGTVPAPMRLFPAVFGLTHSFFCLDTRRWRRFR